MAQEILAKLSNFDGSAQKVRLVVDLVRGKRVSDDLVVYKIFAAEAQTRKWREFGARGRFKPILRRRSHITVVLREIE